MTTTPTSGAADLPEAGCSKHHLIHCSQCRHDNMVRDLRAENDRLTTQLAALATGQATAAPAQPAAQQPHRSGCTAGTDEECVQRGCGTNCPAVSPRQGVAYAALPEPLEIDWPELHSQALGCGVEDRGLHNRYECAEYGWQDGVDKCADRVPEQIFDADQMRAFADATHALRASHGQAPGADR